MNRKPGGKEELREAESWIYTDFNTRKTHPKLTGGGVEFPPPHTKKERIPRGVFPSLSRVRARASCLLWVISWDFRAAGAHSLTWSC